ncbi:MAG: hypothetical protein R3284_09995, partial [Rubricoccaceae bacterium]|nr:hypothetical protein [Rubricoccaceae bacterium]
MSRIDGSENSAAIPLADTALSYMTVFADQEEETPGAGAALFARVHRVELWEATTFLSAFSTAREAMNLAQREQMRRFCARDFDTSDEWAASMTAMDSSNAASRASLLDSLSEHASTQLWEKFITGVNNARSSTMQVVTDHYAHASSRDYRELFDRQ